MPGELTDILRQRGPLGSHQLDPLRGQKGGSELQTLRDHFSLGKEPLAAPVWILGPDVIEDEGFTLEVAQVIANIAAVKNLPVIFKASYEKANRSSASSFRGPGIDAGLEVLARVGQETGLPLTTDVHDEEQARRAAEVVDIIQIPAFLCRQNSLLEAAAATGKVINLKKGQFLSPWDVAARVQLLQEAGAADVWVTERGSSFGYHRLVNDFRAIPLTQQTGAAVIFDATHSVQTPGGPEGVSGGERHFIPVLARAAAAAGADGLFLEVHPDPDQALCDGPNALPLDRLEDFIEHLLPLLHCAREIPDLDL
ncbi:MAG TPA: 3-deoxy-8-phosphooctulonate synthase [Planctomycetes bacterium]|nr:3-deoxy-8-phosphooctulonate synthase [Planctomycetota bacterium]HIK82225.1 3-deoxy-8-phosphooctulonate synthase [Planctomycetota bacterium]